MTDATARAFRLTAGLRIAVALVLCCWLVLAAFPLLWILIMSFKLPVDAFAPEVLTVVTGPTTREAVGGIAVSDLCIIAALAWLVARKLAPRRRAMYDSLATMLSGVLPLARVIAALVLYVVAPLVVLVLSVAVAALIKSALADGALSFLVAPLIGFTYQHYYEVWVNDAFYQQFINSVVITAGVVCVSLTIGATAGYALARARSSLAFWILIAALIFRALPHSVLVAGYLQPFIDYGLYGRHIAVILVLAAINQPFTIWMLRSFFANIPAELDEAAMVDGCSHFQAFRRVIMPVMWPGIITTGLFSFLLGYNDYLVTALLLDGDSMTMVPSIARYFNRETTMTDQVEAVAAAISITAPLFFLVMIFQRQIVSGLVQGAVKG